MPVALIDYDPQRSALAWLAQRPQDLNSIAGIDGTRGRAIPGRETRRVVMDAPARATLTQTRKLLGLADTVLMPVLASPIDIRAAAQFIAKLTSAKLLRTARIGLVGNRVKANTLMFNNLRSFMKKLHIPLVSNIRDTQNYPKVAGGGFGIFELPPTWSQRISSNGEKLSTGLRKIPETELLSSAIGTNG